MSDLTRYVNKERNEVKGWLTWIDAEIISTIMQFPLEEFKIRNILEIGVHRGKSAILFLLGTHVCKVVVIDLFENQFANLDRSGSGSLQEFKMNLSKFRIDLSKLSIISADSTRLDEKQIRENLKDSFDIAHIDGGHSKEVVMSDLLISSKLLSPHGVIIVDDFLRPDWPEVGSAVFEWIESQKKFTIFCIGHNKVFITSTQFAFLWREVIEKNQSLGFFLRKRYKISGFDVPIFYHFFTPEWTIKKRIYEYVRMFHPKLFIIFKKILDRIKL
jgi:predicted O-methyltransferase YrrM